MTISVIDREMLSQRQISIGIPFPKRQTLDSSKLKELADHNFKFDENDRKFSKQEENTVGKEEIACYKQFLLFSQCFQKTCAEDTKKPGLVRERVKCLCMGFCWQN